MKKFAFTLSEILITLGIIGVVAALTLPSVIEKHQKQVTVSKLKKVYSTLSQFVVRTYADNGPVSDFLSPGEVVDADKTKQFFEIYWKPYFNGINVKEDGKRFYDSFTPFMFSDGTVSGTKIMTSYDAGRVAFSTQDGIVYYNHMMNWQYDEDGNETAVYWYKQEVYVDINGTKGPNKFGRDLFAFRIDFEKNVVEPFGFGATDEALNQNCSFSGHGVSCSAKIMHDGWQIKDDYPW